MPQDLAEKLVELNLVQFSALKEYNDKELSAQLNQIGKLKNHSGVWETLKRHPEVAGLMVGTLAYAKDGPERLSRVLSDSKYRRHFMNFCMLNATDLNACLAAADTYLENGDVILKLYEQGHTIPLPETYFMEEYQGFRINPEAEKVYGQWRREFIENALNLPEEETIEQLQYAFEGAFLLREALDKSDDFRVGFLDEYYPKIERVAAFHRLKPFDVQVLMEMPYVWDTTQMPSAEKLFQMYGLALPAIQEGFKDSPEILQRYVQVGLLDRNEAALVALDRFKDAGELERLLSRNIDEKATWEILEAQAYNPTGLGRLQYYDRLSNVALLDDLYPYDGWMTYLPCYYTYKVIQKTIRGQEVSVIEIVFAIADPVLIAVEIALIVPSGGGSVVGGIVIKSVAKNVARVAISAAAKKIAWQIMQQTARRGIAQGVKFTTTQLEKRLRKQMAQRFMGEGFEATLKNVGRSGFEEALKFDITPVVQNTFTKARAMGMKNSTMKKLSGLDARTYMRADRKTVLDLGKLNRTIPGIILFDTAINAGLDTPPAQAAVEGTVKIVANVFDKEKNVHRQEEQSWEQYASALWLMSATGTLDKMIEEKTAEPSLGEIP